MLKAVPNLGGRGKGPGVVAHVATILYGSLISNKVLFIFILSFASATLVGFY